MGLVQSGSISGESRVLNGCGWSASTPYRPRLLNVDTHDLEDKREATDYSVWSEVSLTQALEEQDENPTEGEPHQDERQIELDTDRSFVLYPVGEHFPSSHIASNAS